MKIDTLSDYVQVGVWLGLLEKTVFLLSGKLCKIIDENVNALQNYCWSVTVHVYSLQINIYN